MEAVEHPESELRRSFVRAVADFGTRLTADQALAGKVDAWIANAGLYLVTTYRGQIAGLIQDTVSRWDGEETSRKLELQVGRDLQFIRINGTVVGSWPAWPSSPWPPCCWPESPGKARLVPGPAGRSASIRASTSAAGPCAGSPVSAGGAPAPRPRNCRAEAFGTGRCGASASSPGMETGSWPKASLAALTTCFPRMRLPAPPTTAPMPNGMARPKNVALCVANMCRMNFFWMEAEATPTAPAAACCRTPNPIPSPARSPCRWPGG